MHATTHVFTHPSTGLAAVAKHYQRASSSHNDGITLIFAHGVGLTKELWEPTIARLLALDTAHTIRDAWSIDWQSHGESGLRNRTALASRAPVTAAEYADLLAYFVARANVLTHPRALVAIGHSAGGSAWTLAASALSKTRGAPVLAALVLVEPACIVQPVLGPNDPRVALGAHNARSAARRPRAWRSAREAAAYHAAAPAWGRWDARVLRLYLQHGLRVSERTGEVSTACAKEQEVGVYEVRPGSEHITAGMELARVCARMPVHVVFGERAEMITRSGRLQLCDASSGRRMASVQLVSDAGHMAPQEKPDNVAACLFNIVHSLGAHLSSSNTMARL